MALKVCAFDGAGLWGKPVPGTSGRVVSRFLIRSESCHER